MWLPFLLYIFNKTNISADYRTNRGGFTIRRTRRPPRAADFRGGKFFEKKNKNRRFFLALQENETDCRPIELRLQFAAPMLPLPLIPILPPPSTPAPPHHNLPPHQYARSAVRHRVANVGGGSWGGGGAAVCVIA
jgi:hypothetical protein